MLAESRSESLSQSPRGARRPANLPSQTGLGIAPLLAVCVSLVIIGCVDQDTAPRKLPELQGHVQATPVSQSSRIVPPHADDVNTGRESLVKGEVERIQLAVCQIGSVSKLHFRGVCNMRGHNPSAPSPDPWVTATFLATPELANTFRDFMAKEHPDIEILQFVLSPSGPEDELPYYAAGRFTSENLRFLIGRHNR